MEYNKIIAVTGLPGLYELISSKSDGAIVRSLDDKTTRFVSSRIHNFSHLESIEVYTVRDNVNLVDILKAMEASAEKLPDEKAFGSNCIAPSEPPRSSLAIRLILTSIFAGTPFMAGLSEQV